MTELEQIRSAVVLLTATINKMCNVSTAEEVQQCCVQAKDLLITVYKANINRVTKDK